MPPRLGKISFIITTPPLIALSSIQLAPAPPTSPVKVSTAIIENVSWAWAAILK
ncbi:MAG: hypothetical protein IPN25_07080 [Sphingobacteriales bacterium]|nr:hypothetical protein [Sphingobacteriales bacterium]